MKKLGIGYEDYTRFIDDDMYYVDKTLLISDILTKGGAVTLFTRPRRFGKTLALSMLRTFFEMEYDLDGTPVDKRRYFEGMKVMETGDDVLKHMGQYPVIKMSLKSAKQPNFYRAFMALRDDIMGEFSRHRYVLDSDKIDDEKKSTFREVLTGQSRLSETLKNSSSKADRDDAFDKEIAIYSTALRLLSECLYLHHGKKAIILLDEYDVPLENAYYAGFYDEMVGFVRTLFESALKTNDFLERAVVTGCLRISKESIFTGLNHLTIISVLNNDFAEGFGFTQAETDDFLEEYGLEAKREEVMRWYDGYLFGETEVYNPWSVVYYINDHRSSPDYFPRAYWANTSSNSIIKDMVENADVDAKKVLEDLIGGGTIERRIHEDITYDDVNRSEDNLWNFLFFTGYMRKVSERWVNNDVYVTMRVPNEEIRSIYRHQVMDWFDRIVKKTPKDDLHQAVIDGDAEKLSALVTGILKQTISTFDSSEHFYHGFFLSLLYGVPDYGPKSNREEGDGRPDIVLYPENPGDPAIIFEIKIRKKFNEMEDGIKEAFAQIKDKRYEDGILEDGYAGVVSYGVCFCKKSCIIEKS